MLIDKVLVKFVAGKGADGVVYFGRDRKPSGGDGGNGGDIVLRGTSSLKDLSKFSPQEVYEAQNGERGGSERKEGKRGETMVLMVPIITRILDRDGQEIARIDEPGQEFRIVRGGKGGLGNYNFRAGQIHTLHKITTGKEGEKFDGHLELRLKADVVFIGFPNAGKSTLLNALTNARARVADYPFTTKEPHLGVSGDMILMDLPGLIEGSASGKGLGDRYMTHAEMGELVAHFISLESADPMGDYQKIRTELEAMSSKLAQIPEVILLTKSDTVSQEAAKTVAEQLRKQTKALDIITVTAFMDEDLQKLSELLRSLLAQNKQAAIAV